TSTRVRLLLSVGTFRQVLNSHMPPARALGCACLCRIQSDDRAGDNSASGDEASALHEVCVLGLLLLVCMMLQHASGAYSAAFGGEPDEPSLCNRLDDP